MEENNNVFDTEVHSNYDESQIQVLEGLEAVRKRPGMYIGSTSQRGLHHLVYEIVDNAIDEALAGFCKNIIVNINKDNTITVIDDGRGIPTGIHPKMGISTLEVVFTILHAGGKFGGDGYKVSGGLHGVGSSVVNALSEYLEVRVHDGENIHYQKYQRGVPVEPVKVVGKTDKKGTEVTFLADGEIFDTLVYDYDVLLTRFREQAFLNKGINIIFSDLRNEEKIVNELKYEGGIKSFVEFKNQGRTPLHDEIIYIEAQKGDTYVEIAMQYCDKYYGEEILSFANNINTTEGGTHETGFKASLTRTINDYAKKSNIIKEKDKENLTLSGDDVREGLCAIISVKVTEAQFEGQTKTKLGNAYVRSIVESLVSEKLFDFLNENPQQATLIIEKIVQAMRAREQARKARENARKTPLVSSSLPGKLTDCIVKDPTMTEIYIVEGDSAGGSAKSGRDSKYQAILPLWGKMLNVQKNKKDATSNDLKIVENDKLKPVIQALGAGVGETLNIEKLRYDKIIIMADADVDGAHIQTLLLTFFFNYMPQLIETGHIYLAKPPLYKISRGKKSEVAFSDEERDMISEKLKDGDANAKVEISRYKGLGEMDPDELWETTMDPKNRVLLRVTLEDAERASDIFEVLMGAEVEPRRIFIEENAQYVTNLDV